MGPIRTASRPARLAGEELRDRRHISVLVDGPDELFSSLMPFIVEGFEEGDRAVHIVDPQLRDAHLERLRESGIDVTAATASRQLDLQTWDDAYMKGGRFDRSAQLALVRRILEEGLALGFPRTRLIGTTEWARETETVADLLRYEARVEDLLRKRPDVLVCAYDLNHHSARTIAEVLGIHPIALVGGEILANPGSARASARDRLLAAASELFHRNGVQATGVDSVIEAADVAKATFYRHFPSKDDLVVAWLRDRRARWFDRVRARAEADGAPPAEVIPLFFEAVAEWLETEDFRGCPYLNTAAEFTDAVHPTRPVIREYLQEIEDYLAGVAAAAGYRDPRLLAIELQTLLAGAISLAVASRSSSSALAAREAALRLLATAERDGA
jgi:AcrR family transcriptional regulator